MRRNGFTLIEVLIAMTLLSLMVVLLFSSLRTAAQSWNIGEEKVSEVNTKAVVYQFFRTRLMSIKPVMLLPDERDPTRGLQQAFQGHERSLRFVGALPAASARKGLQLFTIAPDREDSSTLLVNLVPFREIDGDSNPADDHPEVLLKNIADLTFSYFGKTEDVATLQWRNEWTLADRLPALIKVSIRLKDGSYWPDMVFAPKIQMGQSDLTLNDDLEGGISAEIR